MTMKVCVGDVMTEYAVAGTARCVLQDMAARTMTEGPLGGSLRDFCYLLIRAYPGRWA